jgi:hypothetical protein
MKASEVERVAEMQPFLLLQSIYACHAISSISCQTACNTRVIQNEPSLIQ